MIRNLKYEIDERCRVKCEVVYIPETVDERKTVISAIEKAQKDISSSPGSHLSKFRKRLKDYEIQADQLRFADPLDIFEDAEMAESAMQNVDPSIELTTIDKCGDQIRFSNGRS